MIEKIIIATSRVADICQRSHAFCKSAITPVKEEYSRLLGRRMARELKKDNEPIYPGPATNSKALDNIGKDLKREPKK